MNLLSFVIKSLFLKHPVYIFKTLQDYIHLHISSLQSQIVFLVSFYLFGASLGSFCTFSSASQILILSILCRVDPLWCYVHISKYFNATIHARGQQQYRHMIIAFITRNFFCIFTHRVSFGKSFPYAIVETYGFGVHFQCTFKWAWKFSFLNLRA